MSRAMQTAIALAMFFLTQASAWASHLFEGRCFDDERSLNYWVNASETILVGKAEDVVYHTPFEPSGAAACWAQFKVREWLKGSGPDEIWVRVAISISKVTDNTHQDMVSLKYCEIEKDNSYIIYGRHIRKPISPNPPEWIAIASDKGSGWRCPPHEKLRLFGNTVGKVRNILKQDK